MVPGETTVETGLTKPQSALRVASSEYCDKTVSEGWVDTSGGLFGLASTLLNGAPEEAAVRDDYASRIGAPDAAPAIVLAQISNDATAARTGLLDVTGEARAVLASDKEVATSRSDVMSFERALVRAQMSYRSFQGALGEVEGRSDMDTDSVDAELDQFADTIDDAREIADELADKYASLNTSIS
jgi:hypothetical protein